MINKNISKKLRDYLKENVVNDRDILEVYQFAQNKSKKTGTYIVMVFKNDKITSTEEETLCFYPEWTNNGLPVDGNIYAALIREEEIKKMLPPKGFCSWKNAKLIYSRPKSKFTELSHYWAKIHELYRAISNKALLDGDIEKVKQVYENFLESTILLTKEPLDKIEKHLEKTCEDEFIIKNENRCCFRITLW